MHTIALPSAHPSATFAASRREMVGHAALLGPAELARRACLAVERRAVFVAVTDGGVARVDGWLSRDALVLHPAATDDARHIGSVCGRLQVEASIAALVGSLVGQLPYAPAAGPVAADARALAGGDLPAALAWALVTSVVDRQGGELGWVAAAAVDGLVGAPLRTGPLRLDPIDPFAARSELTRLFGAPSG